MNKFNIYFGPVGPLRASNDSTRLYKFDEDDVRSILSDICRAMESQCEFIVSGFGQDRWPLDVGTDFLIFLEQFPDILRAVRQGLPGEIDFYEQGVERVINFLPGDGFYDLLCVSRTTWVPSKNIESVDCKNLEAMLKGIHDDFLRISRLTSPDLIDHPWMVDWLESFN